MIKLWWHRLITKRVDFKLVTYSEAQDLMTIGWEIAKEENTNRASSLVFIEKRE